MKRLLTEVRVFLASFVGVLFLKLLYLTFRPHKVFLPSGRQPAEFYKDPVIIIFWHKYNLPMVGSVVPLFFGIKRANVNVLVSRHGDGRMIGNVGKFFGLKSMYGSSTRGGVGAALGLVEKLKQGENAAMTPDGPKGPANYLKDGVLKVAELSGCKIVPLGVAADRYWEFRSWDRAVLPKPRATICICIGNPITVPPGLSEENFEKLRLAVQDELNILTSRAESNV